jgi:hypothetical protein
MSAAAFLCALAGFVALALAMDRHGQVLLKRSPTRHETFGLIVTGYVLLGCSLAFSLAWLGNPVGFVGWIGMLNAAALLTALSLTLTKLFR